MARGAHVVDVGGRHVGFRHVDWLWPKTEVVDAVGTFRHGEEALAVGILHTSHKHVFIFKLDGFRIEHGIHHYALHEERIVLLTEIITPLQRRVRSGEYGIFISLVDAIAAFHKTVRSRYKSLMAEAEGIDFLLECHGLLMSLMNFSSERRHAAAPEKNYGIAYAETLQSLGGNGGITAPVALHVNGRPFQTIAS